MASRLSEDSLRATYDAGHLALPIESSASDLIAGRPLDLDQLLATDDPTAAIQAQKPQAIYRALMAKGPEDCLEVLRHLSADQVVRIMDYDTWSADRLVPEKVFRWLDLYKANDRKEMLKRFRELDEEYQIAVLNPLIRVYTQEEFERLPEPVQDRLHAMPCNMVYYEILTEDSFVTQSIEDLVAVAIEEDVSYAYSLLNHAAFAPPSEAEHQLAQFRRARLEEDGFVTYEESLAAFRPLDMSRELARIYGDAHDNEQHRRETALVVKEKEDERDFLGRVMRQAISEWSPAQYERVTSGFAYLANALCSACRVEPDDDVGLKSVLRHVQAMTSLGLEFLSRGDEKQGAELLTREHSQTLFRAGLTVAGELQERILARLERHALPAVDRLRKAWRLDRRGEVLRLFDLAYVEPLGFERAEELKGVFNRFPVRPTKTLQGDVPKVLFAPIRSLRDLVDAAEAIDGILGLLELRRQLGDVPESMSLDRDLATGVARVWLGHSFAATPLGPEELTQLVELPSEAVQAITGDFFTAVEKRLEGHADWDVSSGTPGGDATRPVQVAMDRFSDLVMRLSLQRELARSEGTHRLTALVHTRKQEPLEGRRHA